MPNPNKKIQSRGKLASNLLLGVACLTVWPSTGSAQGVEGLEYYGQINQALLAYDDGANSINYGRVDNAVGDNVNRLGLTYTSQMEGGWISRGVLEVGLAPKPSNQVDQINQNNSGWKFDKSSLRKFEVAFSNDRFGAISIGQGDMSARGSGPDYTGTDAIVSTNPAELAGGNFWRAENTGALSGRRVRDSFDNFDTGRRFRLRYDSPVWGGFGLSASVGREVITSGNNSTYVDFLAKFEKSWRRFSAKFEGSVNGLGADEYAGRVGVAFLHHSTGINFVASTAHTTLGPHFGYFKIGIVRDFFPIGSTAISYDHYNGGSFFVDASESLSEGLAVVQNIDRLNMELFAIVRTYDAYNNRGLPNEVFLESRATAFGLRWTF